MTSVEIHETLTMNMREFQVMVQDSLEYQAGLQIPDRTVIFATRRRIGDALSVMRLP